MKYQQNKYISYHFVVSKIKRYVQSAHRKLADSSYLLQKN